MGDFMTILGIGIIIVVAVIIIGAVCACCYLFAGGASGCNNQRSGWYGGNNGGYCQKCNQPQQSCRCQRIAVDTSSDKVASAITLETQNISLTAASLPVSAVALTVNPATTLISSSTVPFTSAFPVCPESNELAPSTDGVNGTTLMNAIRTIGASRCSGSCQNICICGPTKTVEVSGKIQIIVAGATVTAATGVITGLPTPFVGQIIFRPKGTGTTQVVAALTSEPFQPILTDIATPLYSATQVRTSLYVTPKTFTYNQPGIFQVVLGSYSEDDSTAILGLSTFTVQMICCQPKCLPARSKCCKQCGCDPCSCRRW